MRGAPPRIQSWTFIASGFVITWSSIPQTSYRVQDKTNLNDRPWIDLAGDIQATGYISAKTNFPAAGPRRFYCVEVLP